MIALPRTLGASIQVLAVTLVAQPVFWSAVVAAMFSWPIVRSVRAERDLPRSRHMRIRGYYDLADDGALDAILRDISLVLAPDR